MCTYALISHRCKLQFDRVLVFHKSDKRIIHFGFRSNQLRVGSFLDQHDSVRVQFQGGSFSIWVHFGSTDLMHLNSPVDELKVQVHFLFNQLFLKRKIIQAKNVRVEFVSIWVIFESSELQVNYFGFQLRQDFSSSSSDHSSWFTFTRSTFS